MKEVALYIPGQPVPKLRHRVVRRGKKLRAITPEKTRIYEATIAAVALAKGDWVMAGPLRVEMVAVFARPQRIKADGAAMIMLVITVVACAAVLWVWADLGGL